jgi:hypothetical protein
VKNKHSVVSPPEIKSIYGITLKKFCGFLIAKSLRISSSNVNI